MKKVLGLIICVSSLWLGAWMFTLTEGAYQVAAVGTAFFIFFIGMYFMEKGPHRTTSLGPR